MKGRSVQYHPNITKDEGRIFYEKFITLCEVFCASTFVLLSRLKPSFCESSLFPQTVMNSVTSYSYFAIIVDLVHTFWASAQWKDAHDYPFYTVFI